MVVVVIFGIAFLDKSPAPAYAIEQTLTAIDTIHTVHFMAELVKQGPVECWMQFGVQDRKPTHICLFWPGNPLRKVDCPEGSFAINTATNRIFRTVRDERRQNWYIDFAGFFKQSLKAAQDNNAVEIAHRTDPDQNRELIVVRVDENDRQVEYEIDPETKLPIRFTTISMSNYMKYLRQTIAVRNMSLIEYNQPVPNGLFEIPGDAQEVFNEHDIIVHQGVGMPLDGLTEQQACEKIVRKIAEAMNQRDWEQVSRLMFPFGIPPREILAQLNAEPDKPLVTINEVGTPTQQNGYWYIPCKSTETGGKVKDENVPIKFFEFDGRRYCMVMWPD
jgi:hypothetical protein